MSNPLKSPEETVFPRIAMKPVEAAKSLGISSRTLWELTKKVRAIACTVSSTSEDF